MPVAGSNTQLQSLIDLAADDEAARQALLHHACDRLLRLTRRMFHDFPNLRRWEQTDDVFQNAMIRLHRSLADVKPESVLHFFNLAAVQIRRELLDLVKHHFGPNGPGNNHHSDGLPPGNAGGALHGQTDEPHDPQQWSEFHGQVESLPDEEQEIINLIWYEGLSQVEAAKLLDISVRTVKRRWQSARMKLYEVLCEE